jgi:hypothetical protein
MAVVVTVLEIKQPARHGSNRFVLSISRVLNQPVQCQPVDNCANHLLIGPSHHAIVTTAPFVVFPHVGPFWRSDTADR